MNISTENSFGVSHGALPSAKNGFNDKTSSESSFESSSDIYSDTSSEGSNRSFHIGSAPPLFSKSSKRRRRRVIESPPSSQLSTERKCSSVTGNYFRCKFKLPLPICPMSDQTTLGPTVFIAEGKRACIEGNLDKEYINWISEILSFDEIINIGSLSNDDVHEFHTGSVSDEGDSVYESATESPYESDSEEGGSVYESATESPYESGSGKIWSANQLLNRVGISDESLSPLSGASRNKGLMECVFESNVFTPAQLEQRKKLYETEMNKALQKSRKIKCEKNLDKLAKQQPYRIISFFQSIGRSFCSIFEKISSVYTNNCFQPPSPEEQKSEMLYPYHPTHAEVVAERHGFSPLSRENPDVPQS